MSQKGYPVAVQFRKALFVAILCCQIAAISFNVHGAPAADESYLRLQPPKVGDYSLHILNPRLLELARINAKPPNPAHVDSWDWVDSFGNFAPTSLSSIRVIVDGQTNIVTGVGFKRRPVYAPL